jgi:WD40 repeat protein
MHWQRHKRIAEPVGPRTVTVRSEDEVKSIPANPLSNPGQTPVKPQVNFSPDGKYVLSGDSEGRAFFWEWAHPFKIVRTIKAHEGVCIGCAWHPMESSKVVTCGWDGAIKMWD